MGAGVRIGDDLTQSVVVCADPSSDAAVYAVVHEGFEVLEVVTRGMDAVDAAARLRPDLVLLDLTFAGLLGMRTIATIRAASPHTAVIALVPMASLRAEALAHGAFDVLTLDDLRELPPVLRRLRSRLAQETLGEATASESESDPGR